MKPWALERVLAARDERREVNSVELKGEQENQHSLSQQPAATWGDLKTAGITWGDIERAGMSFGELGDQKALERAKELKKRPPIQEDA